jgi:hypothetical protein
MFEKVKNVAYLGRREYLYEVMPDNWTHASPKHKNNETTTNNQISTTK